MSLKSLRVGFLLFFVLSGWVAVNLLLLQPSTSKSYRVASTPSARATPNPLQTASLNDVRMMALHTNAGDNKGAARQAQVSRSTMQDQLNALRPGHIGVRSRFLPVNTGNTAELIRALQRELKTKGYDPGAEDGQAGLVTRAAIFAFEYDNRLPLTAEPSEKLLQALVLGGSIQTTTSLERSFALSSEALDLVRATQQGLKKQGYWPGSVDGRFNTQLSRAIQRFETAQNLPTTGRISGRFMARLARINGIVRQTAFTR